MKLLLTGASGFLGSALARHFHAQGHEVTLLLRASSSRERLGDLKLQTGDCDDTDALERFISQHRPELVIHAACAYGRQGETALQLLDANVRLGVRILQCLNREARPVSFINVGTVLAPEVSPYAMSKHQFVQWGRALSSPSDSPIHFSNVRLQHMYGPGDERSKFTTHVLHACHEHQAEIALTAGEQHRDFIFIDDVCSAFEVLAIRNRELAPGTDVDLGSGTAPSIREFVELAHRLTRSRSELRFGALPYRANEAMHCQADLSMMKSLGWSPRFSTEAGLQRTIELEFQT